MHCSEYWNFGNIFQLLEMMIGNFEFLDPRSHTLELGHFISIDDGINFKVHLFRRLDVDVDPEASVQPRIRDIICLTLDFSHFILVPIDISKRSIFVVSFSDFETDQIAFRRGMKHVFGLKSIILIDGTMTADTSHFSIDQLFFWRNWYCGIF